jgi:hypothetical protein
MYKMRWQILLSAGLLAISAGLYFLHYEIFRDFHHIVLYLLGDIAFLPIEVLLVALILERLLSSQEKRQLLRKLNMVIGAFFSEVGTQLLVDFSSFDRDYPGLSSKLLVDRAWKPADYVRAAKDIRQHPFAIDSTVGDLQAIKVFLTARREFLLRLLENPNLLEHEKFTELLWAVFHLTEELCVRKTLGKLPASDYEHLSGDMRRAYALLITQWLSYMRHLQKDYPYLFSLASRINPFNPQASAEVK